MLPKANALVLPQMPHEYTFNFPCYAPTKITFNYVYTHNHSITDISTTGASLYKHSGGPTYYEFIAEEIDTFRFTIRIRYNRPTNQTIVIGLWSGTMRMQGISLHGYDDDIMIHVTLNVGEEPSYPTEMEVAQAVTQRIARDLAEQQSKITELMQKLEVAMLTNSILQVVVLAVVFAIIIIAFAEIRRMRTGE